MGAVLSYFRREDDGDYEKILSHLDTAIRRAEVALSDIRLRERQFTVAFYLYSFVLYIAYIATYYLYLRRIGDSPRLWLFKISPVILIPAMIYFGGRATSYLYRRKQVQEETHLENLKKKQKLKVEELKRRTSYYTTRNLIERYDPASRDEYMAKLKEEQQKLIQQQQQQMSPGSPREQRAMTTGQFGAPGNVLRQRHPLQTPRHGNVPGQSINEDGEGTISAEQHDVMYFQPPPETPRTILDRVFDTIIGQDPTSTAAEQRYALVCGKCYAHNGLVPKDEYEDVQYACPRCGHFNPSRRQRMNPKTPLLSPAVGAMAHSRNISVGLDLALPEGMSEVIPEQAGSPSVVILPPQSSGGSRLVQASTISSGDEEEVELVEAGSGEE